MGRGRRRLDVVGQNSNWANSSTTAFFLVTLYCHRTEIDPCVRRVGSRLNARNWERTGDTQTENCRASRFIVSLCTRWRFPLWRSFRADGTLSIGNPGLSCDCPFGSFWVSALRESCLPARASLGLVGASRESSVMVVCAARVVFASAFTARSGRATSLCRQRATCLVGATRPLLRNVFVQ